MPAQPRTGRNVPAEGRPDGGAVSQLSLPGVRVELVELPDTISARRRAASSCNPGLCRRIWRGCGCAAALRSRRPARPDHRGGAGRGRPGNGARAGAAPWPADGRGAGRPRRAGHRDDAADRAGLCRFCRWRGLDTGADPALQPDRASGDQPALRHGRRIAHLHADRRPPSRRGWPRREPRILASPPSVVARDEIEGPAEGRATDLLAGQGRVLAAPCLADNISGRKLRGWPVSRILFRGRPLR